MESTISGTYKALSKQIKTDSDRSRSRILGMFSKVGQLKV
jgi:hypothetical protein